MLKPQGQVFPLAGGVHVSIAHVLSMELSDARGISRPSVFSKRACSWASRGRSRSGSKTEIEPLTSAIPFAAVERRMLLAQAAVNGR